MDKSLQMEFINANGKTASLNVTGIKDSVTSTEIRTLMELIISKNIFKTTGGELKTISSANVISRDVEAVTVK